MEKTELLARLESRIPLFETLPTVAYRQKRIMGTESEYGVANRPEEDIPIITSSRLPAMLQNGGEIYEDRGHVEYASPETSNPVSAVAYYEAGKVVAWRNRYSPKLYCNNTDWYGNAFGAHESYFTDAPRAEWPRLIPFLIARTVLCGSGWFNHLGCFEISQRAHSIFFAQGSETTGNRPVLNLRQEPLAEVKGFDRLHLICADGNMSEVSTFLRLGTMSLVLKMLEIGALPEVPYNEALAEQDMRHLSCKTREWNLTGLTRAPRGALDLLALYLERAQRIFAHQDEVTDALLIIWNDTLEKLARNPLSLWRRLDWVAKLYILQIFAGEEGRATHEWLRSQDMAYHSLNPADGLYYHLAQSGEVERVVSDTLIVTAADEPPADTRAYARGKIAQWLEEQGGAFALCANSWAHLTIVDASARGYPRVQTVQHPKQYISERVSDPRETYGHLVGQIKKQLSQH